MINYECHEPTSLPVCTGDTGQCPNDVFKKNGSPCANNEMDNKPGGETADYQVEIFSDFD